MNKTYFLIACFLLTSCFIEPKKEQKSEPIIVEENQTSPTYEDYEIIEDSSAAEPEDTFENIVEKEYNKTFSDEPTSFSRKVQLFDNIEVINKYNSPSLQAIAAILKNYSENNKYLVTNYSKDSTSKNDEMVAISNFLYSSGIDTKMLILKFGTIKSSESYILIERVE